MELQINYVQINQTQYVLTINKEDTKLNQIPDNNFTTCIEANDTWKRRKEI